jgi:AcrR family transcriptional regulator
MTASWHENLRDTRRELILQAAGAEFSEKGLEGASMRSIALRAGCTTGAIYPLFATKEALYAELLHASLSRLYVSVDQAGASAPSAAAAFERGAVAFINYYIDHPFEVNLGLYAFHGLKRQGTGEENDKALNAALLRVLDVLAGHLARSQRIGAAQARRVTMLLFSQMIGTLVLNLAGRLKLGDVEPQELVKLQIKLLLSLPEE